MSLRDDLVRAEQEIARKNKEIDRLNEKVAELQYELNHYRTSVAAVHWLWEQAVKNSPFQV